MDKMFWTLPGVSPEEIAYLESFTKDFTEEQMKQFLMIYQNRRKDPQTILLLTLIGVAGIAGIHRLITGDTALGIIYLLTAGFCFIGTIIDAINYQQITLNYNRNKAMECASMVKTYMK